MKHNHAMLGIMQVPLCIATAVAGQIQPRDTCCFKFGFMAHAALRTPKSQDPKNVNDCQDVDLGKVHILCLSTEQGNQRETPLVVMVIPPLPYNTISAGRGWLSQGGNHRHPQIPLSLLCFRGF
jgi:hypothetical protein